MPPLIMFPVSKFWAVLYVVRFRSSMFIFRVSYPKGPRDPIIRYSILG